MGKGPDMVDLITEHIDIWTATQEQPASGRGRKANGQSSYGIKKLRELILELAVRGKLVSQDTSDEPASVLLEKIAKEKARLVKEGKIKKQKKLPEIRAEEKPFGLPKGWEWSRLGSITQINPRNEAEDNWTASFIPMPLITTSHTGEHGQEIKTWGEIKKGYTHFADGDIGLAKITPCFENSKAVVLSGLENGIGAGTTELHIARPYGATLASRYILLFLKAPMFLHVGKTKMTGTAGQKRVPKDFFSENPLPVPPLAEQHRIVAKVDELMALCDQLEQQQADSNETHQTLVETLLATLTTAADQKEFADTWHRIAAHFDTLFTTELSITHLKQTILQLAVMGKLVPQNPTDEPASTLLEKIAKEKTRLVKEGEIKKQKPLPKISEDEKPFELPEGWEWVRIGDFSVIKGGKRLPKGQSFSEKETPHIYIQVTNMKGGTILRSNLKYISKETHAEIAQYTISKEDLYITIAGTIGDVGVVPEYFDGMNLTENAAKIIFRDANKSWLQKILSSGFTQQQFTEKTNQLAQPKLALHRIASSCIPLPPLAEQQRIVGRVDELMVLCDQLQAKITNQRTTTCHLADAFVQQATTS